MTFQNPATGGVTLVQPAIESPDYSPGVSGWHIDVDGSAEFNDLSLRGTFSGTNYVINDKGIFFYSGPPAAGNLVGSWAQTDGIDDYTNQYIAGITVVGPNGTSQLSSDDGFIKSTGSSGTVLFMADGALKWTWPGTASQAGLFINTAHGSMTWSSGKGAANDKQAQLAVVTSNGVPTTGNADTFPRSSTSDPSGSFNAYHYVSGAIIKSDVLGNTAETWQSPSYMPNWSGTTTFGSIGGGLSTLRYRRDAEDNLQIVGTFTAATGAGTSVFTLPAAYRPKVNTPIPVAFISSGGVFGQGWMYVSASGNLFLSTQLGTAVTVGTTYTINGTIPLGNIA
jgi:hypothetical protein